METQWFPKLPVELKNLLLVDIKRFPFEPSKFVSTPTIALNSNL